MLPCEDRIGRNSECALGDLQAWYGLTERLKDALGKFADVRIPLVNNNPSNSHRVAYGLLARTASNFRGLIILVRAGRVVEARMLARSCIENMLYLNKLSNERESFVRQMEEADARSRQSRGQFMMDRPHIAFNDELKSDLQSFLRDNRKAFPKPRGLDPRAVGEKTQFGDLYLAYSQLSDDAGHPSFTSLERYVWVDNDRLVRSFVPDVTEAELADTLTWGCLAALCSMKVGSAIFNAMSLSHLADVLGSEYHALANP